MEEEFHLALKEKPMLSFSGKTLIATGELAFPFIEKLVHLAKKQYPSLKAEVVAVRNRLFGGGVTVAGLIGGGELIDALRGREFDRLMITASMLKADEPVFLDDVTVSQVEEALGVTLVTSENDGFVFLDTLLGCITHDPLREHGEYKQF